MIRIIIIMTTNVNANAVVGVSHFFTKKIPKISSHISIPPKRSNVTKDSGPLDQIRPHLEIEPETICVSVSNKLLPQSPLPLPIALKPMIETLK